MTPPSRAQTSPERRFHESEFEKYSEEVVEILAAWSRRKGTDTPMPGWLFNRKTKKLPPTVLKNVLKSLEDQERIAVQITPGDGRPGKGYILLEE